MVRDYYLVDSSGAEEQTALLCGGARLPVSSSVCPVSQESSEANTSGKPEHSRTLLFVKQTLTVTQLRVKHSLNVHSCKCRVISVYVAAAEALGVLKVYN